MNIRTKLVALLLLITIGAVIILFQPEFESEASASAPVLNAEITIAGKPADQVWVEVPRKRHEPQLQIEVLADKLVLPEQDNEALLEQALDRQKKKLTYRFASRMELCKKSSEIGTWKRENGIATWRLQLESPNATSLNLGLDRFHMPPGGKFVFSGNHGRDIYTFTSANNKAHGELWTPIVRGSTALLEMIIPEQLLPQLRFRIEAINHGFRGIKVGDKIGGDTSGSCNVDVVCAEGDVGFGDLIDFYRDQIRSVGAYTLNGTDTCSGALINNTSNDRKPYFLTANHCGISAGNAPSMVVYWNFENSTCRTPGSSASGQVGDGDLTVFNSGAIFRATYSSSDFCLVELDEPVNPASNAFFSGWSRENIAPADMVIGIHHPAVAEKRISFEYDPTTRTSYYGSGADSSTATHIRVIDWDEGTTEGGSSGSPLFNSSGQIVGQLHGGDAACGNNSSDWYGRVYRSWTGGGASASRLSDWLDPGATGVTSLKGINMSELISIADNSISEGNSGTQVASLTITLSEAASEVVTCEATITGGDASAGSDFVNPGTQTITFPVGVTTATYDITINGDTTPEEHESIIVTLSNPTNADIAGVPATLLILNDDYISPIITGPTSDTAQQGVSYSAQITSLNTPTSYSISGAPAGMTVDSLSGVISWPSPAIGTYNIDLFASNGAGTGSGSLELVVSASDIVTAFEIPNNASYQLSGDYNWAFHTTETIDGEDSLIAGAIGDNNSAHLDLTINGPDQLLFFRKVSSESKYDFFTVSLDGAEIESLSGEHDWAPVLIDIPTGEHVVRISYTKDGDVDTGSDSVWIDRMTLASSSPPEFNSPFEFSVPAGTPVAIDLNAVFNVTHLSAASLPAGVSLNSDNHIVGTFNSQQSLTIEARNAFGSTTRQFTITPYTDDSTMAGAIGTPTLPMVPESSNQWFITTAQSRLGGSALRSAVISNNEESRLTTYVYGPGTLQFWWQVSSEADCDFGRVYVNGGLKHSLSGLSTTWSNKTLNLAPGINEITWLYEKDGSATDGDDCLYLDDVSLSGFAGWVASAGISPFAAPTYSGTDDDQNSSLMEYALGGSPTAVETAHAASVSGEPGSIIITTPIRSGTTGILVNIQKSVDLRTWSNMAPTTTSPTLRADDDANDPKAFYRIGVNTQ
ncbi:MAG: trypsin-like peptidase domain-containing protein [Luteolibacter sp.]